MHPSLPGRLRMVENCRRVSAVLVLDNFLCPRIRIYPYAFSRLDKRTGHALVAVRRRSRALDYRRGGSRASLHCEDGVEPPNFSCGVPRLLVSCSLPWVSLPRTLLYLIAASRGPAGRLCRLAERRMVQTSLLAACSAAHLSYARLRRKSPRLSRGVVFTFAD